MTTFNIFLILIIIVCFLLILVIMVQNPKGGGLSSSFGGGSNQVVGGVKKTGDFLDKSTWILGGLLVVLILLSNFDEGIRSKKGDGDSKIIDGTEATVPVPEPTDAGDIPVIDPVVPSDSTGG